MYPSERTLSVFNHRQQETEKSALTLTLFVPFGRATGRFIGWTQPRSKKLEDRIAVYQKQLESNKSSKQKLAKLDKAADFDKKVPSRKRRRLKEKIVHLHRRIRNVRKDFMFKTARAIAQKYGRVAIEDLQVWNMTKSTRGTIEEPGGLRSSVK